MKTKEETYKFKKIVKRRALKLGLILLIVAALTRRNDVIFGLLFGLCVGFINFNLMAYYGMKSLQKDPIKAKRYAIFSTLLRFLIIFGAGVIIYYKKGFHPLASFIGFMNIYIILYSYEFIEKFKSKRLTPEKNG